MALWPGIRRQTRYAQSSGAKIAYQVSGTGPPDLVMVPGLVSHLDIQRQQPATAVSCAHWSEAAA